MLARRLLIAGAGGAFFLSMFPPPGDPWARVGGNPIVTADESWDQNAVVEPTATYEGGLFKLWYRGGWTTGAIGYATSPDAVTWTKSASNPVIGLGGSGVAGNAWLPWVYKAGSTYYLSYITGSFGATYAQAHSADGEAWTVDSPAITKPSGIDLWGNRVIWIEGGTWYMIAEGSPSGSFWRMYLYTSSDGLAWSIQNGGAAYGSFQVAGSGAYGGPRIANVNGTLTPKVGSTYHLWYHAAPGAGNLPTNIYHATTTNLFADAWTQTTPNPVLSYGVDAFEVDQVAGPCPLVVAATAYLFYDGDDNGAETAAIGLATAPAVP